jgi:hypothetical protein
MPEQWSPGRVALVREAVQRDPYISRGDLVEWNWRFGVVGTTTTQRRSVCVGCGESIPPSTGVYYVIDTERSSGAGWTANRRYLHLRCEAP